MESLPGTIALTTYDWVYHFLSVAGGGSPCELWRKQPCTKIPHTAGHPKWWGGCGRLSMGAAPNPAP